MSHILKPFLCNVTQKTTFLISSSIVMLLAYDLSKITAPLRALHRMKMTRSKIFCDSVDLHIYTRHGCNVHIKIKIARKRWSCKNPLVSGKMRKLSSWSLVDALKIWNHFPNVLSLYKDALHETFFASNIWMEREQIMNKFEMCCQCHVQ